jgi:hypothetical protein
MQRYLWRRMLTTMMNTPAVPTPMNRLDVLASLPAGAHEALVRREGAHRFHLVMACIFAVICFAGFGRSYWLKVATGTFAGAPIFHIHGLLLLGWTCLYVAQTALVASGRTPRHRAWGMAGIAWFSVMMCSTAAITIRSMHAESQGAGSAVVPILIVSLISIVLASGLFAAAIANVSRPETHKRLMMLVMTVLVQAAVARLIVQPFAPPGPPSLQTTIITGLVTDIFIVVGVVHDWRTRGRPHPVYVWGGLTLIAMQVVIAPVVARSDAAMAIARSMQAVMG